MSDPGADVRKSVNPMTVPGQRIAGASIDRPNDLQGCTKRAEY